MFSAGLSFCLTLIGMISPAFVVAAESDKAVISPLSTLVKLSVALVIVLVVFWLFARIMRQVHGYNSHANGTLKIVGSLSMGQRERVVVLQVGDEQLVVGVTANQINTLHVLEKPIPAGQSKEISSFKEKLSTALKRQNGEG
jgi:flagellar protein FliO/FliZ